MLTEKDFKRIEKEAVQLYGELEIEIIKEIAERISNVGYANTVVYNSTAILQEMGVLYNDIISLIAKYNEQSYEEIQRIFNEAGVLSLKRDDSIYKLAGLNPQGLNDSMLQILSATAEKTSFDLSRLTMTTASTTQTQFINAMNKAYMEVSTGAKTYSTSIVDAVKSVSKTGTIVEYPSGARRSIEVATRMNILTGVNQTSGRLQLMRADELGWDLMEISAHSGARPEHAEWQGKVVSRSGKKGYLSLDDIGYGEVTGFQGVNCRHTWFPYYKGSSLSYSNSELREMNKKSITYNGQKYTEYEASQIQRSMERKIRQNKKEIAGLSGIVDIDVEDELKQSKTKLRESNATLNDFLKQTGLYKDNLRLVI